MGVGRDCTSALTRSALWSQGSGGSPPIPPLPRIRTVVTGDEQLGIHVCKRVLSMISLALKGVYDVLEPRGVCWQNYFHFRCFPPEGFARAHTYRAPGVVLSPTADCRPRPPPFV